MIDGATGSVGVVRGIRYWDGKLGSFALNPATRSVYVATEYPVDLITVAPNTNVGPQVTVTPGLISAFAGNGTAGVGKSRSRGSRR